MSDSVIARVHFEADHSMRVMVDGPDGEIEAGSSDRSADLARLARQAADGDLTEVELRVDRPPWLHEGDTVEIAESAMDPAEGATHRFGQVVGFLPVGGVVVAHPQVGTGVYPPESLHVPDMDSVPAAVHADIAQRSRITGPPHQR